MRSFKDGDEIVIEPWRADAFPVHQGPRRRPWRLRPDHPGRRLHLGQHRRRPPRPTRSRCPSDDADPRLRRGHLHRLRRLRRRLPERVGLAVHRRQGHPPRRAPPGPARAGHAAWSSMVAQHDHEGFGGCTNIGECTAACPKEIPLDVISRLNWDLHARHAPRPLSRREGPRGESEPREERRAERPHRHVDISGRRRSSPGRRSAGSRIRQARRASTTAMSRSTMIRIVCATQ